MKTHSIYLSLTLALLATEILIALYVHDGFIRPFFGDFLAIIFVYSTLMSFGRRSVFRMALASLAISYGIELLQLFHFVEITGLDRYRFLKILIGTSFSWFDVLAYTVGFGCILFAEKLISNRNMAYT